MEGQPTVTEPRPRCSAPGNALPSAVPHPSDGLTQVSPCFRVIVERPSAVGGSTEGVRLRKHLGAHHRLVILGVAMGAAATVAAAALAAFDFGGSPSIFSLQINEVTIQAASFTIDGTSIPPKGPKGTATQDYTVQITAPVTNDTTLLQAFQDGQLPGDAVITLFDSQAQKVVGYDFANASDVSYHETGDRATGSFQQDLVFTSSSLTVL